MATAHGPAAPAAHPAPAPAAPAAAPANNNPHPPAATPAAHPPTPMTVDGALQALLAVAVAAASSAAHSLGDLIPAAIITSFTLAAMIGPFAHPRTRPLAFQFLRWLRQNGVDTIALVERCWGYTIPVALKQWLVLALGATIVGYVAQVGGALFAAKAMSMEAILLFTLVSAFAALLFLGAFAVVSRTRETPSHAHIQAALQSPQAFTAFVQRFGEPSSPVFPLVALFSGATLLGIGHAYFVASVSGTATTYRVYGAAVGIVAMIVAGLAFQVVVYSIARLGAMAFAFVARPVVAVGRAVLVLAVPGITPENQEAALGAVTSFQELVRFTPYILVVGAFGLAHIGLAIALDAPQLVVMTGLMLIALIGLYCGHAMNQPKWGMYGAIVVGILFLVRVLYGLFYGRYWTAVEGMSVTHGGAFTSAIVANVFAAVLIGGIIFLLGWLLTRNRVVAFIPALLVLLLAAPWLVGNVKKVADPTLATPREQQGAAALEDAAQNAIARGGQAIGNDVNRRTNAWVNPPAPQADPTPTPPRREHHRRRRLAASTCPVYTGPGPCNGACQDFVRHNPRQCGL